MLLPPLVLGTEVEGPRVLEVWGEDDGLVASLAGELDTEVPGIEGDEDEVEVLRRQVLVGESIEPVNSISKGTSVSNVLPSQSRETRYGGRQSAIMVDQASLSSAGLRPQAQATPRQLLGYCGRGLTAERSDGGVDGLDKDALADNLEEGFRSAILSLLLTEQALAATGKLTSSRDLASSKIQPSSMTSAESLVT